MLLALATGVVQSLKPIQKRGHLGDHEDGDDEEIDMFDAPSKLFKQTLKQFKKRKLQRRRIRLFLT